MTKEEKLKLLRAGFTEEIIKEKIAMTDDWIALKAVHQSDMSSLEVAGMVDYSHVLFHEVLKCGPNADYQVGEWVIIIRNALDALSSNRQFVVARSEHVVMRVNTGE